jgi:CIC family chloride channel protein
VGGYALVGMAAMVAATTHAPLTAAVMVFELSGDYAIVLPLLLATAVATSLSRWLGSESVYVAELRRRGIAWELTLDGRRIAE